MWAVALYCLSSWLAVATCTVAALSVGQHTHPQPRGVSIYRYMWRPMWEMQQLFRCVLNSSYQSTDRPLVKD